MKKTCYAAIAVLALSLCGLSVHTMNLLPSLHAKTGTEQDIHVDNESAVIIYKKSCASCHDRAIMDAPKPGDPRFLEDINILVENAIKGIGRMPARGHAAFLSEDEVRSVVEYMANQTAD